VLSCSGLRDDTRLSHSFGQQHLTHSVVNLVGAGVVQIFTLEVDSCSTTLLGQTFGKIERIRATDKMTQQVFQLSIKLWIKFCIFIRLRKFIKGLHECFGDISPSILTKTTTLIRHSADGR
jgi:hypothetical protein